MNGTDTIGVNVPITSMSDAVTASSIRPTRVSLGRSVKKSWIAVQ